MGGVGTSLMLSANELRADLTDAEVDAACDGLVQGAAKIRYLRSLGLHVDRKPNGRPLVNRAHYNAVRGMPGYGVSLSPQPNWRKAA